jgi:hypothetical protein
MSFFVIGFGFVVLRTGNDFRTNDGLDCWKDAKPCQRLRPIENEIFKNKKWASSGRDIS